MLTSKSSKHFNNRYIRGSVPRRKVFPIPEVKQQATSINLSLVNNYEVLRSEKSQRLNEQLNKFAALTDTRQARNYKIEELFILHVAKLQWL